MKRPLNLWLLLLAAVCGASLLWGRGILWPAPRETGGRPAPVAAGGLAAEAAGLQLIVLNGTGEAGLAREFGLLLGRNGLAPVGFGNAPDPAPDRTLLVNRRLPEERAARLAALLGGIPVVREFDGRGVEDAVLVLGPDHRRIRDALGPGPE